jgi:hypothetical protein
MNGTQAFSTLLKFQLSVGRFPENVTNIAVLVQSAGQGAILVAAAQPIL